MLMDSTKRLAVRVVHRAKRVERLTNEKRNQVMVNGIECNTSPIDIEEEEKQAYIEFICRLLYRMNIESLRRIMDASINEI